jgi:hypothetical protein
MANELDLLAKRAESDPFFLGCSLRLFAASEKLDDIGLAKKLECTMDTLTMLRLCRAPHADSFKDDLDKIAAKFEVNRDVLAEAARRGQVMLQMRGEAPSDIGFMLAAQDDEEKRSGGPQ